MEEKKKDLSLDEASIKEKLVSVLRRDFFKLATIRDLPRLCRVITLIDKSGERKDNPEIQNTAQKLESVISFLVEQFEGECSEELKQNMRLKFNEEVKEWPLATSYVFEVFISFFLFKNQF